MSSHWNSVKPLAQIYTASQCACVHAEECTVWLPTHLTLQDIFDIFATEVCFLKYVFFLVNCIFTYH